MLVPLRVVLDHAAENGYGVGAFNVNNMEQIQSIMMAADETDSPVIIQASRGARGRLCSTAANHDSNSSDDKSRYAHPRSVRRYNEKCSLIWLTA